MKFLATILLIGWCSTNNNSLENFAMHLAEASNPGVNAKQWASKNIFVEHPIEYLFESYHTLYENWEYKPDGKTDHVKSAEKSFGDSLKGDCEDFATALAALFRDKGLTVRFCLGKRIDNSNKGHIWLKVPICDVAEFDTTFQKVIADNFYLPLDTSNNKVWINFISFKDIRGYQVEFEVTENGTLLKRK